MAMLGHYLDRLLSSEVFVMIKKTITVVLTFIYDPVHFHYIEYILYVYLPDGSGLWRLVQFSSANIEFHK